VSVLSVKLGTSMEQLRRTLLFFETNSSDPNVRGDSWRARASHICELQFNMSHHGMKIDFNGQDRWDWDERSRNLKEALLL